VEGLASRIAERIQLDLGAPFLLEGQSVFATFSIGIALSSHDDDSADVLRRAVSRFFSRATMSTGDVAIGDIYTLPLTSDLRPAGEPTRLTWDNAYVGGIAWTADSRELVFSSGRGDSPWLWRIAVSGSGKPSRLAFGKNASSLAVSGRANRLLYEQRIPADTARCRKAIHTPSYGHPRRHESRPPVS
jgi:hypothetical protein